MPHRKSSTARALSAALSRRALLAGAAGLTAAASGLTGVGSALAATAADADFKIANGRINQSVIHWCFKPMPVETLAAGAARLGLKSLELVPPADWPTLKKLGLTCAISPGHGFVKGFAHKEEHDECVAILRKSIDATSDAGFPSVITFSGMRRGISDDEGLANMVAGLKKIVGYAEARNVTLCLEMLNSRVNIEMKGHPDYFCDKIEMAVEVCKRIGSPRMKVLFDIYHVQIMEGDIIARIKQYHEFIGHYHTAGVPGRNELDESQELFYPPIMRAIVETGYQGYVGQEFIPKKPDALASLAQAARLCDV
ncbi:MAG TPA: TIM barrel protein [Pirellulales bacterium]|nr:TIM barrel protein [Pirellulales bacterium]